MTLLHPVNHFLPASVAPTINPYQLGATLYMPATRQDIWQIISQQKLAEIDSIVICLEDAVSESEIPAALANLKQLLATWAQHAQTLVLAMNRVKFHREPHARWYLSDRATP